MKVLNSVHRSHFGGAQWRLVEVGEALRIFDIETVVLFPADEEGEYEDFLKARSFPYRRLRLAPLRAPRRVLDAVRFFATLPRQIRQVRRLIRDENFALVHVNSATNMVPVLAALAAGVPVLWHWNDMLTPRLFIRLLAPLVRRTRLVVASDAVGAHYRLDGASVLPPPLPRAEPVERPPFARRDGELVLGFVGALVEIKGAHHFVETVAGLRARGLNVRGIVLGKSYAGHEAYMARLHQRVAALGLTEHVDFPGYRRDVAAWMAGFDALLFPSSTEAAPVVVVQTLAAGLPLVSTDVGNVAEVSAGLDGVALVAVGDIAAMIDAAERALTMNDERRRAYGAASRARIDARFSAAAIARRTAALYGEVVGDRTSGAA